MSLLPQFGFVELLVVAIVALIVVGPKDLPKLMRSCGRFIARARAMAGEFTSAFDEMAREAEMEELRNEIEDLRFDKMADEVKEEIDTAVKPVKDEIEKTLKAGEKTTEDTLMDDDNTDHLADKGRL